jgi:hypothetical protein
MTLSMAWVGASSKPGAAWTPTDLGSTLVMWLDASDSTTITESSGVVSQWNDKSGNGYNASQSSSTRRPSRLTAELNGKDVLDLAGRDYLTASVSTISTTVSIFAVAKPTTNWQNYGRLIGIKQAGVGFDFNNIAFGRRTTLSAIFYEPYGKQGLLSTSVSTGTWYVLGSVMNGSSSLITRDGTTATATITGSYTNTPNEVWIGVSEHQKDGTGDAWSSPVAEVVLINSALSSGDRERMEGYLAHKWGLSGSLPSGHPYKTTAP